MGFDAEQSPLRREKREDTLAKLLLQEEKLMSLGEMRRWGRAFSETLLRGGAAHGHDAEGAWRLAPSNDPDSSFAFEPVVFTDELPEGTRAARREVTHTSDLVHGQCGACHTPQPVIGYSEATDAGMGNINSAISIGVIHCETLTLQTAHTIAYPEVSVKHFGFTPFMPRES